LLSNVNSKMAGAKTSGFLGDMAIGASMTYHDSETRVVKWGSQSWLPPAFSRRALCARIRA
jgi:hypothetical protein